MLLKIIHTNFRLGRTKFIAFGERGFEVYIDFSNVNDIKYVLDLIAIAHKQIFAGMYYGQLDRFKLDTFKNDLILMLGQDREFTL